MTEIEDFFGQAIHHLYLEQRLVAGEEIGSSPSLAEWEDLPEEFRESSRGVARDAARLLTGLGYELELAQEGQATVSLSDDEIEQLAMLLHERWCDERRSRGWRRGDRRDDARKLTPYLVPWSDLTEDLRDIDRHFVRELPRLMASLGLTLVAREKLSS